MAKVRMADIAQQVGVSVVTVSKALSDKEGVSDSVRAQIKELAKEMGYVLPTSRKTDSNGRTGNVGIIIPGRFLDQANSFYWELYEQVINRLAGNSHYGILEILDADMEAELKVPRMLIDGKVDGVIMIGNIDYRYRGLLNRLENTPVIFLDSYDAQSGSDSVISDDFYGSYTLTHYLFSMGHREICFVGTVNPTSSITDRFFGYCKAMMELGIHVRPDMVIKDRSEDSNRPLELPRDLPTAFVCNCDLTATQVIAKLLERDLRVPDDVSVVGYDDFISSEPNLTTYTVDMKAMAKFSVDAMIKKISNINYEPRLKIVPGKIKIRDSVKDIRQG